MTSFAKKSINLITLCCNMLKILGRSYFPVFDEITDKQTAVFVNLLRVTSSFVLRLTQSLSIKHTLSITDNLNRRDKLIGAGIPPSHK